MICPQTIIVKYFIDLCASMNANDLCYLSKHDVVQIHGWINYFATTETQFVLM